MQSDGPLVHINMETVDGIDPLLSKKAPHAALEISRSTLDSVFRWCGQSYNSLT